ncbi:MAG: hypothetical protein QM817_40235 [Archangium sp.]
MACWFLEFPSAAGLSCVVAFGVLAVGAVCDARTNFTGAASSAENAIAVRPPSSASAARTSFIDCGRSVGCRPMQCVTSASSGAVMPKPFSGGNVPVRWPCIICVALPSNGSRPVSKR